MPHLTRGVSVRSHNHYCVVQADLFLGLHYTCCFPQSSQMTFGGCTLPLSHSTERKMKPKELQQCDYLCATGGYWSQGQNTSTLDAQAGFRRNLHTVSRRRQNHQKESCKADLDPGPARLSKEELAEASVGCVVQLA